jgi:hypothetical protein
VASCRSRCEVFIDILLRALGGGLTVSLLKPGEELAVSVISCFAERFGPSEDWPGLGLLLMRRYR